MPYKSVSARIVARMTEYDLTEHESVELLCMGDLHIGDAHTDLGAIRAACDWIAAKDNRRALIVGDVFNAALKDSVSDVYSEAMTLGDSREMFVRLFSKDAVRPRILSVISGNHDHRVYKAIGDDYVAIACHETGLPYHQGQAFLKLKVGHYEHHAKSSTSAPTYAVYTTHGWGGGRMVGGKANNLMRLRDIVSADLYVAGHTHTPMVIAETCWECDVTRGNVVEREQLFVSVGAALDRGNGYAVRFGYPSLSKCWPIVTLSGRNKRMSAHMD